MAAWFVRPPLALARAPVPLTAEEAQVKAHLLTLVEEEDEAILRHDLSRLRSLFLPTEAEARAAYRHARGRADFLEAWAKARGVRLVSVQVNIRTPGIRFLTGGRVRVFAVVSEAFTYAYDRSGLPPHTFGLGVRHVYRLAPYEGRWRIAADDFTDPLDQDTRIPKDARPDVFARDGVGDAIAASLATSPGAEAALRYAERYCGAAPGCGNDHRYNVAYNDYNGEGGDCTNFVSQVLKAGGFREAGAWSYDHRRGEGDRAWSNAPALYQFLVNSGRAQPIASGTYAQLTRPRPGLPLGQIGRLRPGDLVAYQEKGKIVHFAVVVGRDGAGYVLVNSHSADRHHVPWDIGWDRHTVFHLLHVRYPTLRPAHGPLSRMPVGRRAAASLAGR